MKSLTRVILGSLLGGLCASGFAANVYQMRFSVPGLVPSLPAAPPAAIDPYFANVQLLLHLDSNTVTDAKGAAVQAYGGAAFSTEQSKFGAGSAKFAGTSKAITAPAFKPSGDYTIEGWIYPLANTRLTFLDIGGIVNVNWQSQSVYLDSDGQLNWWASSANNGTDISAPAGCTSPCTASKPFGAVILNAWNHFAIVRSSNQYFLYLNGTRNVTVNNSKGPYQSNYSVVVGNYPTNSQTNFGSGFNGYLEDVRLTDGVARYTGATYSIPTTTFPNK